MIEFVDRFEAEDERRITVLFQDGCGEERRLEAVRAAVPDYATQSAERSTPSRL